MSGKIGMGVFYSFTQITCKFSFFIKFRREFLAVTSGGETFYVEGNFLNVLHRESNFDLKRSSQTTWTTSLPSFFVYLFTIQCTRGGGIFLLC